MHQTPLVSMQKEELKKRQRLREPTSKRSTKEEAGERTQGSKDPNGQSKASIPKRMFSNLHTGTAWCTGFLLYTQRSEKSTYKKAMLKNSWHTGS